MSTISNGCKLVFCFNSICCPAISVELWCFEILCQVDKVVCRAGAQIQDVQILCFVPRNFQSELSSADLWFVESAYCACVTDARSLDVNSSAVIQRQYWTFDVIKPSVCEQKVCVKVSTILRNIMDSCDSKTIKQWWSNSGRRLDNNHQCNTGPDPDPN